MGNNPTSSKKGDQNEHVKQFLIKAKEQFQQNWENPKNELTGLEDFERKERLAQARLVVSCSSSTSSRTSTLP